MLVSARQLAGTKLLGADGQELGTVREVVVERHQGKLIYALMEVPQEAGGEPAAGSALYPLPWPLLTYEAERDLFHLKADPEHLQRAPRVEVEEPVDWQDRLWAERLHEHYGLQPYWTVR